MKFAVLVLGVVALAAAALGYTLDAEKFFGGWLAALGLLAAWPLGSMALLMTHALTGGRWGEALCPALRLGVCALPLLVPAALPVAFGLQHLYPWARPDVAAKLHNTFYLNAPFLAARVCVYLVVWFVLGWLCLRRGELARAAPAGLFALAITVSFAAIDTTMSLDPHFTSSIYGMLTGAGMALLALSAAVLLSAGMAAPSVRTDFGKLLLALVVLWAYLDFMQLLIVWQSDLGAEAPWYVARSRGFWGLLRASIALGHFVLPFFLLMSPRLQRSRPVLVGVATLLIAMEVGRSWWTVLPSLGQNVNWIDLACVLGLGGIALSFARWATGMASARV